MDTTLVAMPSASSRVAASRQTDTSLPVPMSTSCGASTSCTTAAPTSTASPSVTTGTAWRVRTSAVGPSVSTATRHASAVSLASAGRISCSCGMARSDASCSIG